jgi:hypothetical protein
MTSFKELMNGAQEYDNRKSAALQVRQDHEVLEKQRQLVEQEARADEILEKFGVHDALVAIRDEKWLEGDVIEDRNEKDGSKGWKLATSAPKLSIIGSFYRGGDITLSSSEISLSIRVGRAGASWPGLQFRDIGVLTCEQAAKEIPLLEDQIRNYGIDNGLRAVIDNFYYSGAYLGNHTFGYLEEGESQETFDHLLVRLTQNREEAESLPGQIRARVDDVLDQLWPFLGKDNVIKGTDLTAWERSIKGLNPLSPEQRGGFLARFPFMRKD